MTLSKMYRARAAALADQAKSTLEPIYKERFKKMALAYERLAEKYARLPIHEKKAQAQRGRRRKIKNPKAPAARRPADGTF
jgi:hypothetical protein